MGSRAIRIRVGTSGYSYKEWKGPFYPEKINPPEMLGFYASQLDTVEINNTFYRMPSEKLLAGWSAQVPEDFLFVLKAPRRITHSKQLREAGDELTYLLDVASVLGDKLGPMLFQLPPYFKKDLPVLRDFLALFPAGRRAAFEFRNPSWFDDEVYEALHEAGAALVVSDQKSVDPPVVATASFGYLRLRDEGYDAAQLELWAARINEQPWESACVFFKHEDAGAGPRMAKQFVEILASESYL